MSKTVRPSSHEMIVITSVAWSCVGLLFVTLLIVLLMVAHLPIAWDQWKPASCMPNACFNETVHPATVRQPVNAWSCLTFVLIGLIIAIQPRTNVQRSQKELQRPNLAPGVRVLYGTIVVLIGLGSWFYHASLTFVGQAMDIQGMYLLITFAVLHSISRLRKVKTLAFILVYICFNVVLLGVQITEPGARRYIFAALVVATLFCEYSIWRHQGLTANPRFLFAALIFLLVGFCIWALDITHRWNSPNGFFQGHAVWHVLSALSAGCLYLHYQVYTPRALTSSI